MKTIITFFFILFIGAAAQAQNAKSEVKVETIEMGTKEITVKKDTRIARLYMFKNSQVKRELSFTTKNDKPKLA